MFESIVAAITSFVRQNNNPLGLLILGGCALLEYVFPPFPCDTVTLFGSFLVVWHQWSLPLVFASVMAGAALGAMTDFIIGFRLGVHYRSGHVIKSKRMRAHTEKVMAAFRRHGPAYVVINRFLPGVRAVIFVAAGMAGLSARAVLLYALISAALWNALILALGYSLGANWARIRGWLAAYGSVVYGVLALVAVVWLLRWWWRRRSADTPE